MADTLKGNSSMVQKVDGFLASDGRFFEHEPECQRHESTQKLIELCESHNISPENFFALIREWHLYIKGYYDADAACKEPTVVATGAVKFSDGDISQDEGDHEDASIGDKDSPAFLEQSFGRRF